MSKSKCQMRFYEELNDFLPPRRRKVRFIHEFQRRASIKDMIEALGVPHTEIDLILVNGQSVDFSHIVQDGDHISVYPLLEAFDIQYSAQAYAGGNLTDVTRPLTLTWQD